MKRHKELKEIWISKVQSFPESKYKETWLSSQFCLKLSKNKLQLMVSMKSIRSNWQVTPQQIFTTCKSLKLMKCILNSNKD